MSAAAEGKDAFASRAQPRREARGCERRWHATIDLRDPEKRAERARRARRRAIDLADAATTQTRENPQRGQP